MKYLCLWCGDRRNDGKWLAKESVSAALSDRFDRERVLVSRQCPLAGRLGKKEITRRREKLFNHLEKVFSSHCTQSDVCICSSRCLRHFVRTHAGFCCGGGLVLRPDEGKGQALRCTRHGQSVLSLTEAYGGTWFPDSYIVDDCEREYNVLDDCLYAYQEEIDEGDMAVVYAVCAAVEASFSAKHKERVRFDYKFSHWMNEHHDKGKWKGQWGSSLEQAFRVGVEFGFLPRACSYLSPTKEKLSTSVWTSVGYHPDAFLQARAYIQPSFFLVDGTCDAFDNIRRALYYALGNSVVCGVKWRPDWDSIDGFPVIPHKACEGGIPTAVRVLGLKRVYGELHLLVHAPSRPNRNQQVVAERLHELNISFPQSNPVETALYLFPRDVVVREFRFDNFVFSSVPSQHICDQVSVLTTVHHPLSVGNVPVTAVVDSQREVYKQQCLKMGVDPCPVLMQDFSNVVISSSSGHGEGKWPAKFSLRSLRNESRLEQHILAAALAMNMSPCLQEVDASDLDMTDTSVICLVLMLREHHSLKEFVLERNPRLSEASGRALDNLKLVCPQVKITRG